MMDGTPRQTVSSRRGTSSHADEDDEDAAALGIGDGMDDAKLMIYTLRLSCYKRDAIVQVTLLLLVCGSFVGRN